MPDMSDSNKTWLGSRRHGFVRTIRGVLVGGTLIALVVTARRAGVLQGAVAVATLAMACLSVPVSRQLSRRVLVAGTVLLGWFPMAWWFPAPFPSFGRSGLLLALLLGGLGAWVASGCSPRGRLASLVPHLRAVDVLPFIAAIISIAALRDLFAARTGSRVLALLLPGWDHSSHYAMVHMIRDFGVVTYAAPLTSHGETPSFAMYPQGFHAAVAATMELLTSPAAGSAIDELVVYAHALALVVIVAVTALVAGICALPRLRRRLAVAAPLVTLVTAGFVTGPGATALQDGFPNYVVACALVGMAVLLIVPLERVISPVILGAIGGAIVGIAYGWAFLLVLVLFVLPALILPLSRTRWRASRGQWLAAFAIVLAVTFLLLAVVELLSAIPVSLATQLAAPGAVTSPPIWMVITMVVGSAGLTLVVVTRARGAPKGAAGGTALRTAALASLPIGGAIIAIAIAVLQVRATATISYYFWKFATGLELVCLVVIAAAVAALVSARPHGSSTRRSRIIAVTSSALLVFVASQTFGYLGRTFVRSGVSQEASAWRRATGPNPTGERLLAALHVQEREMNRRVFFLSYPRDARTNPVLAGQWYMALTGTYTDERSRVVNLVLTPMSSSQSAAACATTILREDPTGLIVVGPDVLDAVRRNVDLALRDQVVSW